MYVRKRLTISSLVFIAGLFAAIYPADAQMLTGYGGDGRKSDSSVTSDSSFKSDTSVIVYDLQGYETAALHQPNVAYAPILTRQPSPVAAEIYREDITPALQKDYTHNYTPGDQNAPVDFEADSLNYDEATQTVTATGNVELVQAGRVLRANSVSYNQRTDTVMAYGNVVLTDISGDVHFADEVELTNEMKEGFVVGLNTYMADGGRFKASSGERKSETLLTMHDASYTPCNCSNDENDRPAWQIKASEVTVDEEANKVSYKHARFELFGVPVAYTPFFAHPHSEVDRKSGFLAPSVGYDSNLGFVVTQQYYYDIAPDKDMTVGAMLTSGELPVALAEYRQRFGNAEFQINGSATYSDRNDSVNDVEYITDEDFRGHLEAQGRWDINDKWRSGINLAMATDDQYLREYNLDADNDDVLENEIYAERFSGRHYGVGRLLAFQDTRVEAEQSDQPNVLPEIETRFVGKPSDVLGGRWEAEIGALGLQRDEGQDVTRMSANLGWQRRHATGFGLVNTLDLSVRGDSYFVNDRDIATAGSGRSNEGTNTRILPQAHLVSRMPFVKDMDNAQIVVEPIGALTIAPDINDVDSNIPNEDSQDVQLDASNLFEANRFPGKDRVEDRSRATYGLRTGIYGHEGSHGDIFVGQSYRFHEEDNPFPEGSGLDTQESDVVGQISAGYKNRYLANYRFQLDSRDMSSQRHEFDGYADFGRLSLNGRYLFANSLGGTDIVESREQARLGASLYLTDQWRTHGHVLQDLGENPGLRAASLGIDYYGCCVSFALAATRTITSDVSGDSGTDIMLRIGLKGLGEFQTGSAGGWGASN